LRRRIDHRLKEFKPSRLHATVCLKTIGKKTKTFKTLNIEAKHFCKTNSLICTDKILFLKMEPSP
jgi:hypothetical protein